MFYNIIGSNATEDVFVGIFGEVAIYSALATIATILPSITINYYSKDKGNEIMTSEKYSDQVGFMGDVRDELELICDFVKMKKAKFAVFIDDLDRCPPNKILI